jgi:hypothetical protein
MKKCAPRGKGDNSSGNRVSAFGRPYLHLRPNAEIRTGKKIRGESIVRTDGQFCSCNEWIEELIIN